MELYLLIGLLLVGYVVGTILESRHFEDIRRREAALQGKALTFVDGLMPEMPEGAQMRLVDGAVVISIDAFKRMAAGLQSFFGGRLATYESLMERARREALLRMREKADAMGATMLFGVRFETSAINDGDPQAATGVELIAYGTAIIPHHRSF